MTRQLQELFDLPDDDAQPESVMPQPEEALPESYISEEMLETIDKIESALPMVKGLEASDADMDELGGLAKEAFNNLMDLGMQVDSRFASEIFNSASSMLGHAITAKTAKANKKLKMIDLQLKKAELDRKIQVSASKGETPVETSLGTGSIVDRNELIRMIMEKNEQGKSAAKDK